MTSHALSEPDRNFMAAVLAKFNEDIEKHGFSGVHTLVTDHPQDPDGTCPMSYSVGLTDADQPEIVVTGLLPIQAHHLITLAVSTCLALDKPFELNTPIHGIVADYAVMFKPIRADRLAAAKALFVLSEVRAVQMVWPDANGRFPWEEGYALEGWAQPLLEAPAVADLILGAVNKEGEKGG